MTQTTTPELVAKNVKHLSPSSLNTWGECRRKWGKMYAEKRKGDSIARANTLGTFVHAILEGLYALPSRQRIVENARGIAGREFKKLTESKEWPIINPTDDPEFTKRFKQDAWHSVLNAIEELEDPEEVEIEAIELELGDEINGVPFRGFIDRLDRDGDNVIVNDYKNGKVPTFKDAKRKAARQLVLYSANIVENHGYTVKLARFIYTAHSKIVPVKITDRLLKATGDDLAATWGDIHAEEEFEPTTSALCAFCPFVLECSEGKLVALARLKEGKSVGESTQLLLESSP